MGVKSHFQSQLSFIAYVMLIDRQFSIVYQTMWTEITFLSSRSVLPSVCLFIHAYRKFTSVIFYKTASRNFTKFTILVQLGLSINWLDFEVKMSKVKVIKCGSKRQRHTYRQLCVLQLHTRTYTPSTYCVQHLQSFLETFFECGLRSFLSESIQRCIQCSLTLLTHN